MLEIISAICGILGVALGAPAIILWLLNRRNANKKLQLDEGALDVSVFDTQTKAYQDLLDRANLATLNAQAETLKAQEATEKALAELATYKEERESLMRKVTKLERSDRNKNTALKNTNEALKVTNEKLEKLRELFQSVVTRTGIVLTKEEQSIYDDTVPSVHHFFEVETNGDTSEIELQT